MQAGVMAAISGGIGAILELCRAATFSPQGYRIEKDGSDSKVLEKEFILFPEPFR
jgi:hypothetical protein